MGGVRHLGYRLDLGADFHFRGYDGRAALERELRHVAVVEDSEHDASERVTGGFRVQVEFLHVGFRVDLLLHDFVGSALRGVETGEVHAGTLLHRLAAFLERGGNVRRVERVVDELWLLCASLVVPGEPHRGALLEVGEVFLAPFGGRLANHAADVRTAAHTERLHRERHAHLLDLRHHLLHVADVDLAVFGAVVRVARKTDYRDDVGHEVHRLAHLALAAYRVHADESPLHRLRRHSGLCVRRGEFLRHLAEVADELHLVGLVLPRLDADERHLRLSRRVVHRDDVLAVLSLGLRHGNVADDGSFLRVASRGVNAVGVDCDLLLVGDELDAGDHLAVGEAGSYDHVTGGARYAAREGALVHVLRVVGALDFRDGFLNDLAAVLFRTVNQVHVEGRTGERRRDGVHLRRYVVVGNGRDEVVSFLVEDGPAFLVLAHSPEIAASDFQREFLVVDVGTPPVARALQEVPAFLDDVFVFFRHRSEAVVSVGL